MDLNDSLPDWLDRARAGDEAAAVEVYQRFVKRLIGLARKGLGAALRRKEDPEDVVQSVLKSAFKPVPATKTTSDHRHQIWSLLATITVRKCAERRRKYGAEKRAVGREVSLAQSEDDSNYWEILADEPTGDDVAVLAETIEQWTSQMTVTERRVIKLVQEGMRAEEIASEVSLSARTVRQIRQEQRQRLEKLLKGV